LKPREEIIQHFIDRLKERHGILISPADYAILNARKFSVLYRKGETFKLVKLPVQDKMIPALYCSNYKMLLTVYPADILTSEVGFLRACFTRRLHDIVFMVYDFIQGCIDREYREFTNDKEAALYFTQDCTFPSLMLSIKKTGSYPAAHLAKIINDILNGHCNTCQFTVRAYTKEERTEKVQGKLDHRAVNGYTGGKTKKLKGLLRTLQEPGLGNTAI
jgi:hypothetical protein